MLGKLTIVVAILFSGAAMATDSRKFEFSYEVRLDPPVDGGVLQIFLPLASESNQQQVITESITGNVDGEILTEPVYDNRYWHAEVAASSGPISITVTTVVERTLAQKKTAATAVELNKFLGENQRVTVNHPVLLPIQEEIKVMRERDASLSMSRAIYDWVVDNVEYKKTGAGWGNGDTFWACNERYGNCTDFHALYTSLARSNGIPARFEIGFPIPSDRLAGKIDGYHCWVQFFQSNEGWFPIDASEAAKDPEKRDYYYGAHPLDRIHFTTGRDLQLGPKHQTAPLNYFVYPHVEQDGQLYQGVMEKTFSFRCMDNCGEKI